MVKKTVLEAKKKSWGYYNAVMRVEKVSLRNFRSYEEVSFGFDKTSVVVGENGAGKSNLVEAIYLLAIGKSFRAEAEYEMIRHGENFSRVTGELGEEKLEILLMDGSSLGARKKYFVNGVSKRMVDFVGRMRAVLFGPGEMELVTGSPSGRRRYLDFVVSQVDREYRRNLLAYEKALRQRNKLLDLIREGAANRTQLFFWDRVLIKNGQYLTDKRAEFLAGGGLEYDKSVISEARLKQYEQEEVAAGSTLVGPHRDDFVFILGGRDVSKYGSRGEQRMMVWGLKRWEMEYLGGEPVLLLDDIFSELDHKHREEVVSFVESYSGQVVMTAADEHLVPSVKGAKIIRL